MFMAYDSRRLVTLLVILVAIASMCEIATGAAGRLSLQDEAPPIITGRVVDGQGRPLAAMIVRLIDVYADSDRLEVRETSVTDQQGVYRFSPRVGTTWSRLYPARVAAGGSFTRRQ
jgi:hypothetical protein